MHLYLGYYDIMVIWPNLNYKAVQILIIQICCGSIMDGEKIPKATMNNFIRTRLKLQFSPKLTNKLLDLAKIYIYRLTDKANTICEKNQRKTINPEHLEQALMSLGLQEHIQQVKNVTIDLKVHQQFKQQKKAKIQDNLVKLLDGDISENIKEKRIVQVRDVFPTLDIKNSENEEQYDESDQKDSSQVK